MDTKTIILIVLSVIAFVLLIYILVREFYLIPKNNQKLLEEKNKINEQNEQSNSEEMRLKQEKERLNQQLTELNLMLKNEMLAFGESEEETARYNSKEKLEEVLKRLKSQLESEKIKTEELNKISAETSNIVPEVKEVIKEKEVLKLNLTEDEFQQVLQENKSYLIEPNETISSLLPIKEDTEKETLSFMVEGLMASGPRKADKNETNEDLGEDTCGFVELGDWLYTWVLDGESDSIAIKSNEGKILFNSRTLTQDIGFALAKNIKDIVNPNVLIKEKQEEHLYDLFSIALEQVLAKWNERINEVNLMDKYDNNPYYGSTLIFSCLNKKTNELYAFRLGDSLLITYDDNGNAIEQGEAFYSKQRKSAMYLGFENNHFSKSILELNKDYQMGKIENVNSMILFSDGLYTKKKEIEGMKNLEQEENWLEEFKHRTFARDDKSLLRVQIIKD